MSADVEASPVPRHRNGYRRLDRHRQIVSSRRPENGCDKKHGTDDHRLGQKPTLASKAYDNWQAATIAYWQQSTAIGGALAAAG